MSWSRNSPEVQEHDYFVIEENPQGANLDGWGHGEDSRV
jgi:hypothetical protein